MASRARSDLRKRSWRAPAERKPRPSVLILRRQYARTAEIGSRRYADAAPGSTTRTFLDLWAAASSAEACGVSRDEALARGGGGGDDGARFCDKDGDPTTTAGPHGMFWVDAILTYALAVDADRATREDPDALHSTILEMETFNGVSGVVRFDPETGDRDGKLDLKNAQIKTVTEASSPWLQASRGRRLQGGVIFDPEFVVVGSYDQDVLVVGDDVRFPGGLSEPPEDQCCPTSGGHSNSHNIGAAFRKFFDDPLYASLFTVAVMLILFTIAYLYQKSRRAKHELNVVKRQIEDQLNATRQQFAEEWAHFDDGSESHALLLLAARTAARYPDPGERPTGTHMPARPLRQPQLAVSPRPPVGARPRRRRGGGHGMDLSTSVDRSGSGFEPSPDEVRANVVGVRDASSRLDQYIHDDVLRPIFEPYGDYVRGPLKSVDRAAAKARAAARRRETSTTRRPRNPGRGVAATSTESLPRRTTAATRGACSTTSAAPRRSRRPAGFGGRSRRWSSSRRSRPTRRGSTS